MSENKETTASETKQSTFSVSDPFDSDPGADVVLISCDNAEFRARKAILSFISPVFSDMFSLPQPMTDEARDETTSPISRDGLPFVRLSERGTVIDSLLRYCYPLVDPFISDAYLLFDVLVAAEKYDMRYVISAVQSALRMRGYSQPESLLLMYRRACDQHQEDDARRYAFESLKLPCSTIVRHWGGSSVGALSNLIDYHQTVSMAISNYIIHLCDAEPEPEPEPELLGMWGFCRRCDSISLVELLEWWKSGLLSRVQNIFEKGPMSARLLPSEEDNKLKQCQFCFYCTHENWKQFERSLSLSIRNEADKIKLGFPW